MNVIINWTPYVGSIFDCILILCVSIMALIPIAFYMFRIIEGVPPHYLFWIFCITTIIFVATPSSLTFFEMIKK